MNELRKTNPFTADIKNTAPTKMTTDYEEFSTLLHLLIRTNGYEDAGAVGDMIEVMKKEDAILAKLETSGFADRAKTEREKIKATREAMKEELKDAIREAQREAVKGWVRLHQKANANLDKGASMKVLMEVQTDGSVELVMPMGVAPDTAGYNRNRAFQKERKTKAQARLREKLAEKHAPHTGEECDRCFWEKDE